MEFRTKVNIPPTAWKIEPCESVFCVGSCFADNIAKRFAEEKFPVVANPYGVMYNPISIGHTVERYLKENADYSPALCILTLGTNHVYRLKATGEIVDNCQKRPQSLFCEEELGVEVCAESLRAVVESLLKRNAAMHILVTVSPIRYAKYGFHGSQLSKATLLLACNALEGCTYFPAYELVNDELRDYRFYAADMLHPTQQAIDYIWERLVDACFSTEAQAYLQAWRPLRQALAHRPFHPDSEAYKQFMEQTKQKIAQLSQRFPRFTY